MDIGIVGLGIIGSACKYGFEKLGHRVYVHDIAHNTKLIDLLDCRVIYICVPTPSRNDGSCDTSIVEEVVEDLNAYNYDGVVAIKSTIEPGETQRLIDLCLNLNDYICFVPEFLRERCSFEDFTSNHDLLAVGTRNKHVFDTIVECHGKYPQNIVQLTPTEAELLKYYSNIFNAMRVVFANEMYEVCEALETDYSKIKDAFMLRKTATDMYMDVNENFRGYAGACLIKDTKALAQVVRKLNLDLKLFETIDSENSKFKATVFEGMRL